LKLGSDIGRILEGYWKDIGRGNTPDYVNPNPQSYAKPMSVKLKFVGRLALRFACTLIFGNNFW
jgi:hypothetical protein